MAHKGKVYWESECCREVYDRRALGGGGPGEGVVEWLETRICAAHMDARLSIKSFCQEINTFFAIKPSFVRNLAVIDNTQPQMASVWEVMVIFSKLETANLIAVSHDYTNHTEMIMEHAFCCANVQLNHPWGLKLQTQRYLCGFDIDNLSIPLSITT